MGIEYNQALAESAQANVRESYVYPHVARRVCVRWGDVLDEWNRGRGERSAGGCRRSGRRGGDDVFQNGVASILRRNPLEDDDDADDGRDAGDLTLLDDATAVFVYLLPRGLAKVRPLLREAAARRRKAQERGQERRRRRCGDVGRHPLRQRLPRGLDSSDEGFADARGTTPQEGGDGGSSATQEEENATIDSPPFRVVSYMFSIPGWTPARVDRSSKGGCALFLYENIHQETE